MAEYHSTRECVRCGIPFPIKRVPGRPPSYCAPCREAIKPVRTRKNGARVAKPCQWCGKEMLLKPGMVGKRKACSVTCANHIRSRAAGYEYRLKTFVCEGCHQQVERTVRTSRDSGRYCSRACAFAVGSRVSAERAALRRIGDRRRASARALYESLVASEVRALRRIARRAADPTKNIICKHCGSEARRKLPRFRFCSLGCQRQYRQEYRQAYKQSEAYKAYRRAAKSRRRARIRGAKVDRIDPIKVFERDKWRCHLCGCRTPKRLRGSYEPNAPELDHIIPLAAGGSHTWGNVACSCRECNNSKSDQPLGQIGLELSM